MLKFSAASAPKERYLERLAVKGKEGTRLILTRDLESIEGAGSYVLLHTKNREHVYRGTLNQLSKMLNPTVFIRVHRSVIVNLSAITLLEPTSHGEFEATLGSGRHIQISRTFRGELERRLRQKL